MAFKLFLGGCSKTTDGYTQVATHYLRMIKNPLDL